MNESQPPDGTIQGRAWRFFPEDCPDCGDTAEVYQESLGSLDGDEARCYSCGLGGSVTVYEDGETVIRWEERNETLSCSGQ